MTKRQYADYQASVAAFMHNGLTNLSSKGTAEPFFSWTRCQCCKRPGAGMREECNGYNTITNEIEEYDCICEDCVYYAEYGQLDDMTMLSIEKDGES